MCFSLRMRVDARSKTLYCLQLTCTAREWSNNHSISLEYTHTIILHLPNVKNKLGDKNTHEKGDPMGKNSICVKRADFDATYFYMLTTCVILVKIFYDDSCSL